MVLLRFQCQIQTGFGVWENEDSTGITTGFGRKMHLTTPWLLIFLFESGHSMPVRKEDLKRWELC